MQNVIQGAVSGFRELGAQLAIWNGAPATAVATAAAEMRGE